MSRRFSIGLRCDQRGFTFTQFVLLLSIIGICAIVLENSVYHYAKGLKKAKVQESAHAAYIAAHAYVTKTAAQGGTLDPDTDWETVLAPYTLKVPRDGALRVWLINNKPDVCVQWQEGYKWPKILVADYPRGCYKRNSLEDKAGGEEFAAAMEREKRQKRLLKLAAAGPAMDDTAAPAMEGGRGRGKGGGSGKGRQ
jgi:hypothetical protein